MKRVRNETCYDGFVVVHGQGPGGEREWSSTTAPNSIDLAFLPHRRSIVRRASGRYEERSFCVGQGGTHGLEPIEFVDVATPSDYVEFQLEENFLVESARAFGAPDIRSLPERHDIIDPVFWAVAARFRASALQAWPIEDPEAYELIARLVEHLFRAYLGAKPRRRTQLALDKRQLIMVNECVNSKLDAKLSIDELADAAAVSKYHFIRAFKAATCMTPYEFILSRRMERARQALLLSKMSVTEAASAVGYQNAEHFRFAFKRYFGVLPSTYQA